MSRRRLCHRNTGCAVLSAVAVFLVPDEPSATFEADNNAAFTTAIPLRSFSLFPRVSAVATLPYEGSIHMHLYTWWPQTTLDVLPSN
jgi:hypothetical protein